MLNPAAHEPRFEPILVFKVSAEIGAVAPLSDTHGMSGGSGMTPSSRDRLSVDLHGLKAALFERARLAGYVALGLGPGDACRGARRPCRAR